MSAKKSRGSVRFHGRCEKASEINRERGRGFSGAAPPWSQSGFRFCSWRVSGSPCSTPASRTRPATRRPRRRRWKPTSGSW
jgi:hypothetical protein